jgi:hypothetical protein
MQNFSTDPVAQSRYEFGENYRRERYEQALAHSPGVVAEYERQLRERLIAGTKKTLATACN